MGAYGCKIYGKHKAANQRNWAQMSRFARVQMSAIVPLLLHCTRHALTHVPRNRTIADKCGLLSTCALTQNVPITKQSMVVSLNKGTLISTPKCSSPYWGPQKGTPNFGKVSPNPKP